MAILDDQGRFFGKVNLIDAGVAFVVLALIPLAFTSWLLFRTPIVAVEPLAPIVLRPGQQDVVIEIRGRNLRPSLRAYVGTTEGIYLFQSSQLAEVRLQPLNLGIHDFSLWDDRHQIMRQSRVVTVKEPADDTSVELDLRIVTRPEVLDAVRLAKERAASAAATDNQWPRLVSYEVTREFDGPPQEGRLCVVKAVVRVMASSGGGGWISRQTLLRTGDSFSVEAPTYVLSGEILAVRPARAQ